MLIDDGSTRFSTLVFPVMADANQDKHITRYSKEPRRCERCEEANDVRVAAGLGKLSYPPHHKKEHYDTVETR
jgi:hypothetical protein